MLIFFNCKSVELIVFLISSFISIQLVMLILALQQPPASFIEMLTITKLIKQQLLHMIDQAQQTANPLDTLLSALPTPTTLSTQLDAYHQLIAHFQHANRDQLIQSALHLLTRIPNYLLRPLFDYFLDRITAKNINQLLQNALLPFLKSKFDNPPQPSASNSPIIESLMLSKCIYLLQKLCLSCSQSQGRALNVLCSATEMLVSKANNEPILNLNFTFTTLLAIKILQSPSASAELLSQSLRHLLIVELIQKGQISQLFLQSEQLLNCLLRVGQGETLDGYWLALITALAQAAETQPDCTKIYELEQFAMKMVMRSVEQGKDLTEQIYNLLQSDKTESEKKDTLQTIRGICIFVSGYVTRLAKSGYVEQTIVALVQQLMAIKDFLAFEFIARAYAQILQLDQRKSAILSPDVVFRIERNCLPQFRKRQFVEVEYDTAKVQFLAHQFQNLVQYSVSAESASSMKILSDKILGGRGCLPKAHICSCYNQYIHSTIQSQYDQQFNEHEFMSVTHLMCRQITRVCELSPSQEQLDLLKEYLVNNIKWLLNLNESCLPQHRKCINHKTLDLILAFPYILQNNQFLERVTYDLLISRIPHTFHHLHAIVAYLKSQQSGPELQAKLDRASQQLIEKAKSETLSLQQKIWIWDLVLLINQKSEKIGQFLEVYSLYEDQWLAKYCAGRSRKLKLPQAVQERATQIIKNYQKDTLFFREQLRIVQFYSK